MNIINWVIYDTGKFLKYYHLEQYQLCYNQIFEEGKWCIHQYRTAFIARANSLLE